MPLDWPPHLPRTPIGQRRRSKFSQTRTWHRAARDIVAEVERLGGGGLNISSNLRLRADGLPYSDQRNPENPGVAVYFTLPSEGSREDAVVMGCDVYERCEDNLHALALTIEAKRAILRHGVATGSAEFRGYLRLPASTMEPSKPGLHQVLGIPASADADALKDAWRVWVLRNHPDKGGSSDEMVRVKALLERALEATP